MRWVSGVGVLALSYPVLVYLKLESHFLLYLPVAVAGFTALGLSLSLKKGKVGTNATFNVDSILVRKYII